MQNQQVLLSWAITAGATSYEIERSLDNVTFTSLATVSGSPLATTYLDTTAALATQYYYKVAATNADGTSPYTQSQWAIPAPTSEYSLKQLRELCKLKADMKNSNFVTDPEWNQFINLANTELYDLLIMANQDYFIATPVQFQSDGSTSLYPLPNGSNTFLNGLNTAQTVTPPPFYKLTGVDLAMNSATNAYVTVNSFNFIDRNRYVYPNTSSTIYGVFNMQYRLIGTNIELIPTPSAGQGIRLWYIPRLQALLQDTDLTTLGFSGWLQYVIVRAAKYALDKEESDTTKLDQEILFLKARIEETASARDVGQPDRISSTRDSSGWGNSFGGGFNGPIGGF